jgi:predicted NAD/FAD-dependent oxidoreductase
MITTLATMTISNVPFRVSIIGGGITGSSVASVLCSSSSPIRVDLFDPGRSGVGGRSSTRRRVDQDGTLLQWDHGCQFFRADTKKFRSVVSDWMELGIASEWKGKFCTDDPGADPAHEFFGLPSQPPFYVGSDGMQSIPQRILSDINSDCLNVFTGTRVSSMERTNGRWSLFGTNGQAAYHDTCEKEAQSLSQEELLGEGYDAVVLSDVSSSFGSWHRASAGVPESFARRVRQRVGARVPLFTAMICFATPLLVDFDAMSFHKSDSLWFAAKMQSKSNSSSSNQECWTLVSTPEYAMQKISETPMQDPKTGEFIPQSKDYLTTVPAPDLLNAFQKALVDIMDEFPDVIYLNAQRWGSAMPSHRHLDRESSTRRVLSGVPYDSGRAALAPTIRTDSEVGLDFIADDDLMLFQAGDMMSRYTPGFESAAMSGMDAAEHLLRTLQKQTP